MSFAVVILAGGEGRRIGGGKPLLDLNGERLIDRSLRFARSWSDLVAIAVRDPRQVEAAAELLSDEPGIPGPLAGLIAAGRFAAQRSREFVLTIPADMPFLPSNLADRLSAGIGVAGATVASSRGQIHPVCALWRVSALDAAPGYAETGRRSLKGFAATIGFTEVEWPTMPEDPFFNINLSEDLAQAERRLRS